MVQQAERDYLKKFAKGNGLDIGCGNYKIAGFGVDNDPSCKPDLIADIANIPLKGNRYDYIVCVHPTTMIRTPNGEKEIINIKTGDEILTHKNIGIVDKIYKKKCSGEIFSIIPRHINRELKLTGEHPVLAVRRDRCKNGRKKSIGKQKSFKNEWINTENLLLGDYIIYRFNHKIKDIKEINLKDIIPQGSKYKPYISAIKLRKKGESYSKIAEKLDIPRTTIRQWVSNKKKPSECYFKKDNKLLYPTSHSKINEVIKVDCSLLKILGYYASDGDISAQKNSGWTISFSFGTNTKEKGYAKDVIKLMKDVFNISPINDKKTRDNVTRIRFSSKILCQFFSWIFGEKKYAHEVSLPNWAMELPKNKQMAYLQGYINGDGSIDKKGHTSIVTTSPKMANQLVDIILRCGLAPSIHKIEQRMNQLNAYKSGFLKNPLNVLSSYSVNFAKKPTDCKIDITNGRFMVPIRKITRETYYGDVYNLSVKNDQSYATGTCIVHNCSHVLEHSVHTIRTLKEWHRLLKSGGTLAIAIPNGEYTNTEDLGDSSYGHVQLFSMKTLCNFLEFVGFNVEKSTYFNKKETNDNKELSIIIIAKKC